MRNSGMQLGIVAVVIGLGIGLIRWTAISPSRDTSVSDGLKPPIPSVHSEPEIIQASYETLPTTTAVPQISVHVWLIEFKATSPDVTTFSSEFDAALGAAIEEFNSQSSPRATDFAASETLAALVTKFNAQGKVTIYDEPPRLIADGETDNWGTTLTISATPTIKPADGKISVAVSAAYEDQEKRSGMRTQTTLEFRPGQTLKIGGTIASATETKPMFPQLGQIPKIGPWLSLPITRTRSCSRSILVTPTIVADADASSELE